MYDVYSLRISLGGQAHEGTVDSLEAAVGVLMSLGSDPDCVVAEVEQSDSYLKFGTVAQCERVDGSWAFVMADIRPRTRGGEALEILQSFR